jgi:Na+/proline symporter
MQYLGFIDYVVIVAIMASLVGVGLYFTKKGGADMDSFFLGGRSLPWYIAGTSMIATSFAADTPLWVTNLVREHGIHYIWQFWAPLIGSALAVVYFGRKWRRMSFVTDVEFMEARYSGASAKVLRGWSGAFGAIIMCPLISGWVIKAMQTIASEAMGLPPAYHLQVTIAVVSLALLMCGLSGLLGVVYTDFIQFMLATLGTLLLAFLSVRAVGGLDNMVEQLNSMSTWSGNNLGIAPHIGSESGQMSIWNAIGLFGFLWIGVALSGAYQAQRLLSSRDSKNASYAQLLHTVVYYALMAWPWILVALCSMILLPELGEGVEDQAAAYPRMIVTILPIGLRGLLVAALLAAFISTISTMFNWGSSYLVNDIYRRFINKNATEKNYVLIARIATFFMAMAGAYISVIGENIQQLITLSFVVASIGIVPGLLRWLWWRTNGKAEIAGLISGWILAALLVLGKLNGIGAFLFDVAEGQTFFSDGNLYGARMFAMAISVGVVVIAVSLLTPPEDMAHLKKFILRARPFAFGWKPVIKELDEPYTVEETFPRTLGSWAITTIAVLSALVGVGRLLLGPRWIGLGLIVVCAIASLITLRRIREDCANDKEHADFLREIEELEAEQREVQS